MNDATKEAIDAYEEYMRRTRFRRWFSKKIYPLRCVKYGHQRIHKGFCDMDVWNIDIWFYRVVVPMIDRLRRTGHGIPNKICENHYDVDGNLDEEAAVAEWDRELRKMIWLFRESDLETSRGGKLKGDAYREKCKERAFSMFCEYFHDLWD